MRLFGRVGLLQVHERKQRMKPVKSCQVHTAKLSGSASLANLLVALLCSFGVTVWCQESLLLVCLLEVQQLLTLCWYREPVVPC